MPEADKAHQADKIAVQVDGRSLALTNLAKVLYPADGFTKAEVLDYYQRISPVLLPHIAGRPMTLRRFPHGVGDLSFFEKHAPAHRPDWVRTEEVVSRSSRSRSPGETISYLVIDDLPSLIWVVNLAALELLDDVIQCFQGARHAQADEMTADPLDRCVRYSIASHGAAPAAARRLPTAS